MKNSAPFLISCLLLTACAAYDGFTLNPGASEAEVRSTMGAPAMEFRNPDGTRDLVYPRGPLGSQTFMAEVGSDGTLKRLRNVLSDDTFNRIQPGMTEDEILRMIGPPRDTEHFPRQNQTAWDWKYKDTWGYDAIFSVMFDPNRRVVSKFTRRIDRPRMF